MHARNAVLQLALRIKDVKEQAHKSEEAVLEITKDMKRLDYAKRHLQRTITALKRLHMLLHAAEQLRMAAMISEGQPVPNYKVAAHLIDATRLLLGHFEGYMGSVPKMRQVRDAVGVLRGQLRDGIVKLFYEVGFPEENQGEMSDDFEENTESGVKLRWGSTVGPPSGMVQSTLADACLVIEALGSQSKEEFITTFVSDHLEEYERVFDPSPAAASKGKSNRGPKSFKKSALVDTDSVNPLSLDQVEKRFAWYRDKLRSLQLKFNNVFPPHWNVHYRLTASILERTARHLKFVLKKNGTSIRIAPFSATPAGAGVVSVSSSLVSAKFSASLSGASTHGGISSSSTHGGPGTGESSIAEGEKAVTALLKALQKTILFEKEMTAWLSRDFGTTFIDPAEVSPGQKRGEDDDALEFDSNGRAVPAGSAEGIRIKYERQKKYGGVEINSSGRETGGQVPPLVGIASVTFDDHMSPYVALEERTMDELLHAAQSDNTVDTRGDRPVFVSSTNLFIYMRNSITRCTALTKEKTFFLLQRAFQKKLRSYANVLEKKLPQPQSQNVAKLALANIQAGASSTGHTSSSQTSHVYRIPPGEEVTVCHVIDTCEYCADTVEALEDLIRDKIGGKYKEKVDMSEDQDAFQEVTAKSIRVLVSGLEQRLDAPMKEISRTNWSSFDIVGEESSYVRTIHLVIHPFVVQVRELIPSSYFRSFCDKFAMSFATYYYRTLVGLKRISEAGTQQLLLDVYSIKTLLLKLPVLEGDKKDTKSRHFITTPSKSLSGGSTIAPAIYMKMVNKEFRKIEVMLKLVGSPKDMLIDMFRAQWDCSIDTSAMASDFQIIMNLKGIPRNEQPSMLENLGLEGGDGTMEGSSSMTANIQALQERGSDVAAKVNADLSQMRQRVDDFRKAFR
ncbi:hypothetical protein HJC23_000606 [Cyclotella cryptica]|uniref:Vps53 N-terminal domain-containing protein n=1 Tax=Cyclotella cryptica TaxID=29204 RepID=A0ABD3NHS7_9STRA